MHKALKMKYFVAIVKGLISSCACSTPTTARPQDGLYFELRGTVYLPGSTVLIADIGTPGGYDPDQPGGALVCVTTNINTQCCRNSDGGNVGEWYFPDGTIVPRFRNPGSSPFARTGSTQQARLNHRLPHVSEPVGDYQCRVPDINGTEYVASANLQFRADSVAIKIGNATFQNNSILPSVDILAGSEIHCIGGKNHCCSFLPERYNLDAQLGFTPSGIGSWLYPNSSYVRPAFVQDSYGITPEEGSIVLHPQASDSSNPDIVEGVWRCEVPDDYGNDVTLTTGVYQQGGGLLNMTKETSLSIKSLSPLIFSIFCTTTGGPPTTVVWDRSSMHGQPIQTETVTSFEDSTYLIEFIVSQGIIAGDYKVAISNAISYVSSSFNASGYTIIHNGRVVPNNTIVEFESITEGSVLLCSTDSVDCCLNNASWNSPNGDYSTDIFSVHTSNSSLIVNRTGPPVRPEHNGMWHCQMPYKDGIDVLFVGLFGPGLGAVSLDADIQFTLISPNPPKFSLACVTTGGPATSVRWMRNGEPISSSEEYSFSQIVLQPVSSTYSNGLTVSGRHLGMYRVSITNSRQSSPVESSYEVTEEAQPTDVDVSLVSDDGILVSWTSSPAVHPSSIYIISLESFNTSDQVSVSGSANSITFRGLIFGRAYDVSLTVSGPAVIPSHPSQMTITIGIPDAPEGLLANADVTFITLSWSPPSEYHGPIAHYEVEYRCADANVTVTNTTLHFLTLAPLKPGTYCVFQMRAFTTAGASADVEVTNTTMAPPMVDGIQVSVLDANTVRLSWEPVTVLEWEVAQYTISYTAYHTHLTKSVHHYSALLPNTTTSKLFYLTHTDPKFEHWFTVTVSIQVQGEEFQSEPSEFIFQFDESFFYLRISPVENCVSWEDSKVSLIEESILTAITESVSELCNCSFSTKLIRAGEFRCWDSPNEVTYLSSIVGTDTHNSSHMLEHMNSWVRSKVTVVRVKRIAVRVLNDDCGVGLSCRSEEEEKGQCDDE